VQGQDGGCIRDAVRADRARAFFAAPLYASVVAETTFAENRLSEQITLDGERTFIVTLEGVPIGPTWQGSYFLGADQNGRDLMVRLLYGGRNSLIIGAGAVLLTVLLAVPIVALTIYLTIVVVLVNAIVDVVIAWLDPRIRRAGLLT
jgi:peptide/nickel transport system permease protein